jgi:hypothetical protein
MYRRLLGSFICKLAGSQVEHSGNPAWTVLGYKTVTRWRSIGSSHLDSTATAKMQGT